MTNFDVFWQAWPKKEGKKPAKKKWEQINPDCELAEIIIKSVEKHKQWSKRWRNGFIPHAATWLHQERWEDDFEVIDAKEPTGLFGRKPSESFKLLGYESRKDYEDKHTPTRAEFLAYVEARPDTFKDLLKFIPQKLPDSLKKELKSIFTFEIKEVEHEVRQSGFEFPCLGKGRIDAQ